MFRGPSLSLPISFSRLNCGLIIPTVPIGRLGYLPPVRGHLRSVSLVSKGERKGVSRGRSEFQ